MNYIKSDGTILNWVQKNRDIGIFLFRLFIGARLVYGVSDNVFHWEHMVAFKDFLDKFHFPFPLASAIVSVSVQFTAGLLLFVGYKIRLSSLVLILNFLVALFMVHHNDSFEAMTPALAMLFGCVVLFFYGPDKYSMEHFIRKRN